MPVWPKRFLTLGTSVLTAATSGKLHSRQRPARAQRTTFEFLKRRLATTSFWSAAGIEAGMSYEDFRQRIAPRGLEQLALPIAQMQRGEANILWPGRCVFFAATSGTSTGKSRSVPVTADMLGHFRRAARDALLYYTARVGHAGVFAGRHLFLAGSTALSPLPQPLSHEAYSADLGGILTLSLSRAVEKHLLEPGPAISQLPEGLPKFDAIAARVSRRDITLIAGLPNWTLQFADAMRETGSHHKTLITCLQALWPNLECLVHMGAPVGPYHRELQASVGPTVKFHEVYPACEGIIAAQDGAAAAGMRLMTESGIFFEFLPLADFDETRLEQLGPKAIPAAEVKAGVDYVPLLTTPGGLARYCLGDVVRFTSAEPARLVYVGRTNLRLNAFGERVVERELCETLLAVCQRHHWSLVNFHVAPRFAANLTGGNRGSHEWWIELRPGLMETPIGPHLASEIDAELQRLNPEYATRRGKGSIDAPTVRLVMPGVFEHWLRYRGQWGGQNKTPRCRSDRLVADDLTKVTNFARD